MNDPLQYRTRNPHALGDGSEGHGNGSGREKRRTISRLTSSEDSSMTSTSPEPRKLRASCDGCYLAKIKCGKERPQCRRCANHGTSCVYSPSQRTGKPRKLTVPPTAPVASHMPSPATTHQASPTISTHLRHDSGSVAHNDEQSSAAPYLDWPLNWSPPLSDSTSPENSMAIDPALAFAWQGASQSNSNLQRNIRFPLSSDQLNRLVRSSGLLYQPYDHLLC